MDEKQSHKDGFGSYWRNALNLDPYETSDTARGRASRFWWKYIDAPLGKALAYFLTPFFWAQWISARFLKSTYFYRVVSGLVGNPMYGAAVAFIGFVAGATGSIYSDEIRHSFPFSGWKAIRYIFTLDHAHYWAPQFVPVYTFWGLALVWLYLFTAQEAVKSDTISSLQVQSLKLEASVTSVVAGIHTVEGLTSKIREAVFTLPPEEFVSKFNTHVTNLRLHEPPTVDRTDRVKLEKAVRNLLAAVVGLAYLYDKRGARYAANVMVFVKRQNDYRPHFPKLSETVVKGLLADTYDLVYLRGALVLVKEMTVALDPYCEVVEDVFGKDLAFPIPINFLKGRQWLVFPGAPRAYVRWNDQPKDAANLELFADTFDDIGLLRERCGDGKEFDLHGSIDEFEGYYLKTAEGRRVKSLQAYPLVSGAKSIAAFGVVNIHCDKPVFLGGTDDPTHRQKIFSGLITPLIFDIAELTNQWFELTKSDYLKVEDN